MPLVLKSNKTPSNTTTALYDSFIETPSSFLTPEKRVITLTRNHNRASIAAQPASASPPSLAPSERSRSDASSSRSKRSDGTKVRKVINEAALAERVKQKQAAGLSNNFNLTAPGLPIWSVPTKAAAVAHASPRPAASKSNGDRQVKIVNPTLRRQPTSKIKSKIPVPSKPKKPRSPPSHSSPQISIRSIREPEHEQPACPPLQEIFLQRYSSLPRRARSINDISNASSPTFGPCTPTLTPPIPRSVVSSPTNSDDSDSWEIEIRRTSTSSSHAKTRSSQSSISKGSWSNRNSPTKAFPTEEEKLPSRPTSTSIDDDDDTPSLLLSAHAAENYISPHPHTPRFYTVASLINTIKARRIRLPIERTLSECEASIPGVDEDGTGELVDLEREVEMMRWVENGSERESGLGRQRFDWGHAEMREMMGSGMQERYEKRMAQRTKQRAMKHREAIEAAEMSVAEKSSTSVDPTGWNEGLPKTETFHCFLDLPRRLRRYIIRHVLVVEGEDVVPYHYIEGKIMKNADGSRGGIRTKPQTELLVALCLKSDQRIRQTLDDARNVLYRGNRFSFRSATDLILFAHTIGYANLARLHFFTGEHYAHTNVVVTEAFFRASHCQSLEMKWLARWGAALKASMLGRCVMSVNLGCEAEEIDEGYEEPDITRALASMAEVLRGDGDAKGLLCMWGRKRGRGPLRIHSLDLGEAFAVVADRFERMELGSKGGSDEGEYSVAIDPEHSIAVDSVETLKGEEKSAEMDARNSSGAQCDELLDLGDWYMDVGGSITRWDGSFVDDDCLSEDSGWYPASVFDEYDEAGTTNEDDIEDGSITSTTDSSFERDIMNLLESAGPCQQ